MRFFPPFENSRILCCKGVAQEKNFVAVSSALEGLHHVPLWVREAPSLLIKSHGGFLNFVEGFFLTENSGSLEVLLRNSLRIRGALYWSEVYLMCC